MTQTSNVAIPRSLADKLVIIGQALIDLATEMKHTSQPSTSNGSGPQHASHPKRPKHIPKDQEWFWTDEWQAGEREVDADIAAGRISKAFTSVEELIASLNS